MLRKRLAAVEAAAAEALGEVEELRDEAAAHKAARRAAEEQVRFVVMCGRACACACVRV